MTYEEEVEMIRDAWVLLRKTHKALGTILMILGRMVEQADRCLEDEEKEGEE
jgi:hypothetical protein